MQLSSYRQLDSSLTFQATTLFNHLSKNLVILSSFCQTCKSIIFTGNLIILSSFKQLKHSRCFRQFAHFIIIVKAISSLDHLSNNYITRIILSSTQWLCHHLGNLAIQSTFRQLFSCSFVILSLFMQLHTSIFFQAIIYHLLGNVIILSFFRHDSFNFIIQLSFSHLHNSVIFQATPYFSQLDHFITFQVTLLLRQLPNSTIFQATL